MRSRRKVPRFTMGYTIGDVLTVIGFIFGMLFAIWALLVCFALLFPVKVEKARRETQDHPWRAFFVGVFFNSILAILAGVLVQQPLPLGKLVGWGFYLVLLGTIAVGGSGLALLASERIQQLERRRGSYRSLERGAMLLVAGALLPIFGWFGFAPIVFTIAGGAGFRALYVRKKAVKPIYVPQDAASREFVV
jgi:hypothetical protein